MDTNRLKENIRKEIFRRLKTSMDKDSILRDIRKERFRQLNLWGVQKLPDTSGPKRFDQMHTHGICSEQDAKEICQYEVDTGNVSWANIAVEELAEAIDAKSDKDRREELVQLAAVCVAWIEDIDSRE